jgi:hypothetical protein
VHIFVSHPELVHDLCAHLERADWVIRRCGDHEVEVHLPHAPSEAQAQRELDIYLAVWQAMHRGVEVYRVRARSGT